MEEDRGLRSKVSRKKGCLIYRKSYRKGIHRAAKTVGHPETETTVSKWKDWGNLTLGKTFTQRNKNKKQILDSAMKFT